MKLPPIHRQVVVPAVPQAAFDAFTGRIGEWWPVDRFSVHGAGSTAAFRDGVLVETGKDGAEAIWGTVLDWRPPRSFRMTWHPGHAPEKASLVEVSFAPVGESATLVTVRHEGWESLEDRTEYLSGWPAVLFGYSGNIGQGIRDVKVTGAGTSGAGTSGAGTSGAGESGESVTIVLSHTTAPGVGDPFEHPLFAEHVRFLRSLREKGILLAAGPFAGEGNGMIIVRVSGVGAATGIVHDAHFRDGSVTGGLLEVQARPWVVTMAGSSLA